jgi:hypothetical protein
MDMGSLSCLYKLTNIYIPQHAAGTRLDSPSFRGSTRGQCISLDDENPFVILRLFLTLLVLQFLFIFPVCIATSVEPWKISWPSHIYLSNLMRLGRDNISLVIVIMSALA